MILKVHIDGKEYDFVDVWDGFDFLEQEHVTEWLGKTGRVERTEPRMMKTSDLVEEVYERGLDPDDVFDEDQLVQTLSMLGYVVE